MVTDPYQVLGIPKNATMDEIKRAYRQKGKEFHPDLHPDDPTATKKMAEINEAYDILTNPEKYQKREQEAQRQNQSSYGGTQNGSYGRGGWYAGSYDYGGFEDFFGWGRTTEIPNPTTQPGDSADIRQAIDFINMKQYQYANQTLNGMISSERNARWYYLSALANHGLGNTMFAEEQIRKAIRMSPNNELYQRVLKSMRSAGNTYEEAGQTYRDATENMQSMCTRFCLAYFFCTFCRCC